jgi:nucleoside-diphosphate-sugar epimerase
MMPTYSISKIAAEAVVRFVARQFNLRTTIARFSVPYGNNGGWPWFHLMMMKAGHAIPVHTERPSIYNPIHEDDYISQIPRLLEIASVPATIVNWAGSEQVSIEEWCEYLGQITGLEVQFEYTDKTLASLPMDLSRMHHYLGETKVPWRDGLRRMVEARNPELLPKDS